jgi:hypothetical protein
VAIVCFAIAGFLLGGVIALRRQGSPLGVVLLVALAAVATFVLGVMVL